MKTRGGNVRGGGQYVREKLSFFNELDFLPCAQEGLLCFVSGEVENCLLLPSTSVLIISVNRVAL